MNMLEMKWGKMDFVMAHEIRKMFESAGYKGLASYWYAQREAIIATTSKPKCDNREFWNGVLHGFKLACEMPEKVMAEAQRQKEGQRARKELDESFSG